MPSRSRQAHGGTKITETQENVIYKDEAKREVYSSIGPVDRFLIYIIMIVYIDRSLIHFQSLRYCYTKILK